MSSLANAMSSSGAGAAPTSLGPSTDTIMAVVVLAFVAINMGAESKYADLYKAVAVIVKSWRAVILEVLGFAVVVAIVVGNLLLHEEGQRANSAIVKGCVTDLQPVKTFGPPCPEEMIPDANNQYLVLLRGLWPVLLHPDSLLVIHELLVGLGALLLLARGACAQRSGALAVALCTLSAAHGARFVQWQMMAEYLPEGPFGWRASVICISTAFAVLFLTTCRALWSVRPHGHGILKSLCSIVKFVLCVAALLASAVWLASENHVKGGETKRDDVIFVFFYTAGGCAAPFLLAAVCSMAENISGLDGGLIALTMAQVANLWWLGDFFGALDDPYSMDPVVHLSLEMKESFLQDVHGHPVAVMSGSQIVQVLCALFAAGAYAVIAFSKPESVSVSTQRSTDVTVSDCIQ